MAQFKFEKLIVWQKSMDLAEKINSIIDGFPEKEKFNLSSQILRAAD
jgi:four helix bundle protein